MNPDRDTNRVARHGGSACGPHGQKRATKLLWVVPGFVMHIGFDKKYQHIKLFA